MVGAVQDASRTPAVPEGGAGGVFEGGFDDVDVTDADAWGGSAAERDEL